MEIINMYDLLEVLAQVLRSTCDFTYNTIFYKVNINIPLIFSYNGPLWLLISSIGASALGLGGLIKILFLGGLK